MGRLSNLILRGDDGVILGALHLVSAEINRYRAIVPHVPYRYPPPQTRTVRGETLPRLRGETVTADRSARRGAGDAGRAQAWNKRPTAQRRTKSRTA